MRKYVIRGIKNLKFIEFISSHFHFFLTFIWLLLIYIESRVAYYIIPVFWLIVWFLNSIVFNNIIEFCRKNDLNKYHYYKECVHISFWGYKKDGYTPLTSTLENYPLKVQKWIRVYKMLYNLNMSFFNTLFSLIIIAAILLTYSVIFK